ncbi:MAG: efflux RND transporter periplasmic adaptor subunit [Tannerella sp.]|jgi:Cu(I)/Ag(I) efflux system membrane fusion protein|nr:efflux RND transporter periplasmic adaptor subunit [Tannerella sp.]
MNVQKLLKNKFFLYSLTLVAGILIGKALACLYATQDGRAKEETTLSDEEITQMWTCSMHPQIRQHKAGKCPLCAMELIAVKTSESPSAAADPDAIALSDEAAALADVRTAVVRRSAPVKEIHLYGTIKPNERLLRSLVAHVAGRIETLAVNYNGENVRKGQVVATVYSPDLLNAQQELFEAKKIEAAQPALLAAAREKLRLLKLDDKQIDALEKAEHLSSVTDVRATAGGIVVAKGVKEGDYVAQGDVLFELIDLSSVWAVFDAYEADAPYLKTGDEVEYRLQMLPGKTFSGKIAFIEPTVDKTSRTVRIRVETPNPRLELKPEMYADATVKIKLDEKAIVIPKTAALWTGKRSIAYVKRREGNIPSFKVREIELGALPGDEYIVLSGLDEGEEIAVSGVFAIDAAAQLEGKRSMMNMGEGREAVMTVQGLCDMCRQRIEKAAASAGGVSSARWESETKALHLRYDGDKTSPDVISKAIADAGHDTDKHKADDAIYNSLPDCCKYRDQDVKYPF